MPEKHNNYGPMSSTLVGAPATRRPAKPPRRVVIEWAKCCKAACDLYEAPQVGAICDDYLKALSDLAAAEERAAKAEGELASIEFNVKTKVRAPSPELAAAAIRTGNTPLIGGRR